MISRNLSDGRDTDISSASQKESQKAIVLSEINIRPGKIHVYPKKNQ